MKYIVTLILTFVVGLAINAQDVVFNESNDISRMMDRYINNNRSETTLKGWRIQLVSTNDRRAMEAARSKFAGLYPGMQSSWKHMAPYYQVRVGAYENKTKLMAFLMQIKNDFPLATPIVDDIDKIEFVR